MSEVKPVASIKTLARYEPDTVYIGSGEYVADCFRADDGEYYLAADVDAAVEALRVEVMGLTARAERAEARVAELERAVARAQARIDALMLEYCPDEMTPEQVAEWARHQRPVSEQAADAIRPASRSGQVITAQFEYVVEHVAYLRCERFPEDWDGKDVVVMLAAREENNMANPTIVHCDNCGCDLVDNGINPIGCPYCKTTPESTP